MSQKSQSQSHIVSSSSTTTDSQSSSTASVPSKITSTNTMVVSMADRIKPQEHHRQYELCMTRAKYRQGKEFKAVKVYTINQESRHLILQNIPAVGLTDETKKLCQRFGQVEAFELLPNYPCAEFTQAFYLKYTSLKESRFAKKNLDNRSFYGGLIHICYAPELESVQECREKLIERQKYVKYYVDPYCNSESLQYTLMCKSKTNQFLHSTTKTNKNDQPKPQQQQSRERTFPEAEPTEAHTPSSVRSQDDRWAITNPSSTSISSSHSNSNISTSSKKRVSGDEGVGAVSALSGIITTKNSDESEQRTKEHESFLLVPPLPLPQKRKRHWQELQWKWQMQKREKEIRTYASASSSSVQESKSEIEIEPQQWARTGQKLRATAATTTCPSSHHHQQQQHCNPNLSSSLCCNTSRLGSNVTAAGEEEVKEVEEKDPLRRADPFSTQGNKTESKAEASPPTSTSTSISAESFTSSFDETAKAQGVKEGLTQMQTQTQTQTYHHHPQKPLHERRIVFHLPKKKSRETETAKEKH